MTTYINSFYSEKSQESPRNISTDAKPSEYRGYLIYQRVKGHVWDIVKDGVCVGMNAGPNGAKRKIDSLLTLTQ